MGIELPNFYWEQERLVQVETQPHHVAGLLANIRETLANSDAEWEDIYSAYYECPEDGTVTKKRGFKAPPFRAALCYTKNRGKGIQPL
jgi:hypothetical protein